ncbi:LIC10604 family protein [Leptospira johnsonii]|uniref:Polyketide cyclase/dehydrase and lipid transport n=1 Tax=Leptospira johnsonii TaxID=1917820 RepID=A0A2P2D306_9LEPT|nr:SRPBCC family protein [Leptospira johnsonii]GBF39040.1 polyketide cyclase/dehydrase and lipid transport [Leptospira johnsonii]
MKIVWIILLGLVGLIVLLVLSGYLLPKDHIASVEKDFSSSPESIYKIIRNVREYKDWRSGLKSVELESDTIWMESDSHGNTIRFGIIEERSPNYLKTKILSEDLPFGGGWEFEINPNAPNTKLKITEKGFVTNPLFRVLSKFVFGHDATMKTYLEDLSKRLESAGK